ncbi:hypothetical protein [Arenimonas composti]|uniref:hypothetical protein n=1 Tax=Arenimonas composti TaxID=370776 RepID=UPI0012B5659D|nr:hypothetical protein [Arenimonas composti]
MKIKQIALLAFSAALGASMSGYLVWRSAANEHKRLMRIEINNGYINSLDGVSTGRNMHFSLRDFQESVDKCLANSAELSARNSLPNGSFSLEGWKEFVDGGVIGYAAVKAFGDGSPVYACIFDSAGNLQETRLVLPVPSQEQNLFRSIKKLSFLEVDF